MSISYQVPPWATILMEIDEERQRQDAKWGEQNHPDGTGPDRLAPTTASGLSWDLYREAMRDRCDQLHTAGAGTWEHILTEEYAEAMAESDPALLREELIQVAAVAVAWIECLDRRRR